MVYNTKPRVAELIRGAKGGMKEHFFALVKGLIESEMEVIALCKFSSRDRNRLRDLGATIIPFKIRGRINPIRDLFAIFRLARLLKKNKVDLLHCHGFRAGIIGRISAWLAGCRCVYTIHNFLPLGLGRGKKAIVIMVERILARITKRIITVSKALKRETQEGFGIDQNKIELVYNGIDPPKSGESGQDIRKRWGVSREDRLIGTVARLIPSKGLEVLLDAMESVSESQSNVKLMIVGDGPERSNLTRKAEELNCSDNIIFAGHTEYIWYYYEAFDIFVLPSLTEGLGISILEAMAMGKPVIATNAGGIGEIVSHGSNGYLVPPGDGEKLADAMLYYLVNPDKANEFAMKGISEVREKFTLQAMIKETSRLIFDIIDDD